MTQNNNQNLIKFYSISQNTYNKLSHQLNHFTFTTQYYLLKHKIQKTTLNQTFQYSQKYLQQYNLPIDLIKIISIISYIQYSNQQFNQSNFINYCQQLNLQKNI